MFLGRRGIIVISYLDLQPVTVASFVTGAAARGTNGLSRRMPARNVSVRIARTGALASLSLASKRP
jgi:hypothetical protein